MVSAARSSTTEEIREDCWNTSVIYGDIDYKNIVFKKLFAPKECVHSTNNIDKEFNAHQSGGRIILIDKVVNQSNLQSDHTPGVVS